MIHSVYFLTDVASVTNQPLLLLQFLIYLDGWLITIPPSHTSGSPLLFLPELKVRPKGESKPSTSTCYHRYETTQRGEMLGSDGYRWKLMLQMWNPPYTRHQLTYRLCPLMSLVIALPDMKDGVVAVDHLMRLYLQLQHLMDHSIR